MSYQSLLCEQSDSVLKITLNRPEKLNALTDSMLQELQARVRQGRRRPGDCAACF